MSEFCLIKISKYNVPCEQEIVSQRISMLFPSKIKIILSPGSLSTHLHLW